MKRIVHDATKPCPECGEPMERDEVDVGPGVISAGAWGCPLCFYIERRPDMGDGAAKEMPKYQSHKTVHALKIASIAVDHGADQTGTDDVMTITPEDEGYAPFTVPHAYVVKHNPQPGGYYVVYEDGYCSFSPAAAFESGYTRI